MKNLLLLTFGLLLVSTSCKQYEEDMSEQEVLEQVYSHVESEDEEIITSNTDLSAEDENTESTHSRKSKFTYTGKEFRRFAARRDSINAEKDRIIGRRDNGIINPYLYVYIKYKVDLSQGSKRAIFKTDIEQFRSNLTEDEEYKLLDKAEKELIDSDYFYNINNVEISERKLHAFKSYKEASEHRFKNK